MSHPGSFQERPEPDVTYASETDSILDDFYNPYLSRATRYDRIAGYFSSTVYLLTWPALHQFILENDGQIRMICSPKLQRGDVEAIKAGQETSGFGGLREELEALVADEQTQAPTRLLAALIAHKRLHLKVAKWGPESDRLYKSMWHDKVGIFYDTNGDAVTFAGSMNETYLALSPRGNIESIDVSLSWAGGRDAVRAKGHVERFEHLFHDEVQGVSVTDLPEDVEDDLVRLGLEVNLEDALNGALTRTQPTRVPPRGLPSLRKHQEDALETWKKAGYQGIFEHATGAGKTRSGLTAAALALENGLRPIVVVPSIELLEQWAEEATLLFGMLVEKCGTGYSSWSKNGRLEYLLEDHQDRLILTVLPTARGRKFMGITSRHADNVALITDEVHRIGSQQSRAFLERVHAKWRLGLSATPERYGDPEGTTALMEYFGGTVHEYTLRDGIRDRFLVPYEYYTHFVSLTETEQIEYDSLTRKISALMARNKDGATSDAIERLAQRRAEIGKRAAEKTAEIVRIVKKHHNTGQRWLVYCADIDQLEGVVDALGQAGYEAAAYHSKMKGDRKMTLRRFENNGGILVAIKCLDEGVNIPDATHALIAASSQNTREFIQRRGRVLRRTSNKNNAVVIDVLVQPGTIVEGEVPRLLESEIARAALFAETATNGPEVRADLLSMLQEYSLDASAALLGETENNDDE